MDWSEEESVMLMPVAAGRVFVVGVVVGMVTVGVSVGAVKPIFYEPVLSDLIRQSNPIRQTQPFISPPFSLPLEPCLS